MLNDVHQRHQQALDESHFGHPTVIETVYTGSRGRPSIQIDPEFLRWAYSLHSIENISIFLGVSRCLVRLQLLEYGIVEPQQQPANLAPPPSPSPPPNIVEQQLGGLANANDDLLDPVSTDSTSEPPSPASSLPIITSYTAPQTDISDDDLDILILHLRRHFRRAGIAMLGGMLLRLGYRIPRERIRHALIRIDPLHRVFQQICIRRRTYKVPGPNFLWHHDGQHGK